MMRSSAFLIALAFSGSCGSSQPSQQPKPAVVTVAAPSGAESLSVEWRSFQAPGVGTILMAVARPAGKGPFPAIVILHGTHGFAREYVQLAKELSRDGVVAVAACWFAPGEGPGMRLVSPVNCPPGTPRISDHQSSEATGTIEAVVGAVRTLPGVKSDEIALLGHSRGAGAVWNYFLHGGKAQAAILNSAGYPDELIQRAGDFGAPVLILHGENDTIGPMTSVKRARAFESALRRAGKPVVAVYYPTGEHGGLFVSPSQHQDEVMRVRAFLRQHLGNN